MDNFIELICERIKEIYAEEGEIKVIEIRKNNGILLKALLVKNFNQEITPIIYLEDFYELYIDGEDIDNIANIIWKKYQKAISCKEHMEISSIISDWDKIKNSVRIMVINKNKNMELLKTIPHGYTVQ